MTPLFEDERTRLRDSEERSRERLWRARDRSERALPLARSLVPVTDEEKARMEKIIDECDIDLRPKALSKVDASWGNAIQLFSLQNISYSHKHYGFRKNLYALVKHPNPMIPLNRILFNLFYLRIEPSVTKDVVQRVEKAMAEYDALLADGREFLCGNAYTLADAAVVPLLHRMHQLAIMDHFLAPEDGKKKQHLLDYWTKIQERKSYKKVFADFEPKTKIQKAVHAAFKKRRKFVNAVGVEDAFVPDE